MKKKKAKATARRRVGQSETGCKYVLRPELLGGLENYVQVWVPKKAYDKLVKVLVKKTKNSYARSALRRRVAAVGLSWDCKGSCSGGFCNEVQTPGGAYVCECSYYV
jgi:hypothetical protein